MKKGVIIITAIVIILILFSILAYFFFGREINIDEIVDSDGDWLSDEKEIEIGTDPNKYDTDGDLFSDGREYYSIFPDEFEKECFKKSNGKTICI
tara:strand:+ start:1780 stop:2064 length:285 start_codon:yes stop_codon:yes gene_type:complete